MATVFADFVSGEVQENPLSNVATTLVMSGRLQNLPNIVGPDVAYLTIDPEAADSLAGSGTEVVKVTAYTTGAGTATVVRGQRGTTNRPHSQGVKIVHPFFAEDWNGLVAVDAAEAAARAAADSSEASTRASAVSSEASTRASADTTLQTNIDNEATNRAGADNSEASTRASADTTLQTNINNEASTRASADSTEATNRANGDSSTLSSANSHADSGDATEAAARAAADLLRPKLIGAAGGIAGGTFTLGTDQPLEQTGRGTVHTDSVEGSFSFNFPVAFPAGVLRVDFIVAGVSAAAPGNPAAITLSVSSSTTKTVCWGVARYNDNTAVASTDIDLSWRAVGW